MALDAIIISGCGEDSFSGTNHLRLTLDGKIADIQVVLNYFEDRGKIVPPIKGDEIVDIRSLASDVFIIVGGPSWKQRSRSRLSKIC